MALDDADHAALLESALPLVTKLVATCVQDCPGPAVAVLALRLAERCVRAMGERSDAGFEAAARSITDSVEEGPSPEAHVFRVPQSNPATAN